MRWVQLLCLLSFVTASTTQARIGETPEQCEARYGKAYESTGQSRYYRKSGLLVAATFFEGKADAMSYRREETNSIGINDPLSSNEIEQLRKAESQGSAWKKSNLLASDCWSTEDGQIISTYNSINHILTFFTPGRMERVDTAKKAAEDQKLKDF